MTDFNWSPGAHNLKFGVNLLRIQNNIVNDNFDIGLWTFNGQFTGDGMADFLRWLVQPVAELHRGKREPARLASRRLRAGRLESQ